MTAKKTFLFQLITVIALSLMIPFQQVSAATMTDIPAEYKKEIDYLVDNNYIAGYPGNKFKPNNKITREEVATILGRVLQLNGTQRLTQFPDVNKNSFGSGYIASAVNEGIISGYTDGTFRPKANITRGHISIMLERAFDLKGNNQAVYSDVPRSNANLYNAVDAMHSNGIIIKRTNGKFQPNEEITRAEFSVMIARSINQSFRQDIKPNEYYVNVSGTDTLNVRSGPGMEHGVTAKLPNGTKVLTAGTTDNWQYIQAGSVSGYVYKAYLVDMNGGNISGADVSKRYVAIDAGHGGHDPGSSGNGLVEKVVTLEVAKKVEKALEKRNVKVLMTRTNDTYVGLQERVNIAERAKVDALVSIHTNSFSSSSANGTETFYNLARTSKVDDSKQLATFIQNRLYKAINTTNRGVKTANFAVTRTTFPSTLVELAFITNKQDAAKLKNQQQVMADAIADGILDYYNWKDKK